MKQALNLTLALAVTIVWAAAGPAQAAGDDPLLVPPDVLIIVDTSGSMDWDDFNGRNRQLVVREVLTGSYNTCPIGSCCDAQKNDGILDKYGDMIRFGFGTFDSDPDTWEYGPDYDDIFTLINCTTWEPEPVGCGVLWDSSGNIGMKGRSDDPALVYPVEDIAHPEELSAHSDLVQDRACQANAVGATPLAASLVDAKYMFQDPTNDWKQDLGYTDPLDSCREEFVILLTDGEDTQGASGYGTPAEAAAALYNGGNPPSIPVYVISFGGSQGDDPELIGAAGCPDCSFIDDNGDEWHYLRADDPEKLFAHFDQIMSDILSGVASRTRVTTQPSVGAWDTMYRYYAYFEVAYGPFWNGFLMRDTLGPDTDGDGLRDPVATLNFHEELENQNWNQREIYTIISDPRSKTFTNSSDPDDPLNYNLPRDLDRLGPSPSGAEVSTLRPLMCLENNSEDMDGDFDADDNDINQLVATIVEFLHGKPGSPSLGGRFELDGPRLGDIFHSSPVVVAPPTQLAPDYRYQLYHEKNKDRHTMLYVGANDGMLHAFVAEDHDGVAPDETGKELWAFVPNYLLSRIQDVRRGHNLFVDGTAVVRDVFFRNVKTTDEDGTPLGDDIYGEYRTVLISGLRGGGPAYFALDVTDPEDPKYLWEYRVNVPIAMTYDDAQCSTFAPVETWAKPIVGQVWLKEGDDYISKTVAIVPGGYQNPKALSEIKSCVEFAELMIAPGGLHVIDVETGKLLEKFRFGPGGASASNEALLQNYYTALAACQAELEKDPTYVCPSWEGTFKSDGYPGTLGWAWGNDKVSAGEWACREHREYVQYAPTPPPGVMEKCMVVTDTATDYQKQCCYHLEQTCTKKNDCTGQGTDCVDGQCVCDPTDNGIGPCHYSYTATYDANGDIETANLRFKGNNCADWGLNSKHNRIRLELGTGFNIEAVAGTPAAYNTAFGEYLTRIFLPSTAGNVWRLDVGNGKYDKARFTDTDHGEGDIIGPYTVTGGGTSVTYDWEVGSSPWYSVPDDRPIMTEPTIALDYERNLVLFFGTGDTANLEYVNNPPKEYFYAVKETRTADAEGFLLADDTGTDFHPRMALPDTGERMYGAPLVLGGNVFFTTYVPVNDLCFPGSSYTYGMTFDTFEGILDSNQKRASAGEGTASAPTMQWNPSGESAAVVQVKGKVKKIPVSVRSTAQILQWGKVL